MDAKLLIGFFNNALAILVSVIAWRKYRIATRLNSRLFFELPLFSLYLILSVAGALLYKLFRDHTAYTILSKYDVILDVAIISIILFGIRQWKGMIWLLSVFTLTIVLLPIQPDKWTADYYQILRNPSIIGMAFLIIFVRNPVLAGFATYGILTLVSAFIKTFLSEPSKYMMLQWVDPFIFSTMCFVWAWRLRIEFRQREQKDSIETASDFESNDRTGNPIDD